MSKPLNDNHLRREVRTALELALAASAPSRVIAPLAQAAGLFEALVEFPLDSPAVLAMLERTRAEASAAVEAWSAWRREHPPTSV